MDLFKYADSNMVLGVAIAVGVIAIAKFMNSSREEGKCPLGFKGKNPHGSTAAKADATKKEEEKKKPIERRNFTLEELKEFNGENDKPIYIGVVGEVYDVSSKRDFYGPGAGYHLFAGREASRALAKMSFDEKDLNNEDLSDLGFMDQDTLQDWVMKFSVYNGYPNVGRVIYPRDLTLEQVAKCNGVDDPRKTVYVVLKGKIYDVTLHGWNHYGPEGSYKQFAGKDASRALACMSFEDEYLSNPSIENLTEQQQKTLEEWVTKFEQKYPVIGKVLTE